MQFLKRLKPTVAAIQNSTANTIYVDSDDESIKVGTGASGTGERQLLANPSTGNVLTISSTAVTSTVPVVLAAGADSAPSMTFTGDLNTGLYWVGADVVGVSIAGGRVGYFAATKYWLDAGIGLSLGGDSAGSALKFGASEDVSLSRGAANRLDLATGDSLYLVSGGLGVGTTPPAAGSISAAADITLAATGVLSSTGRWALYGPSDGVLRLSNSAGSDFTRLLFGGATSSFGALARDGAGIQVIAGDGTTGAFFSGVEQTAPAAPAADGYRIFAQDNGAGKTQLMVIFSSGAAQQIAIQP